MDKLRDVLVLIKGAGDLGSGVALRLKRCGFSVIMTEVDQPLAVRRTVSFSEAVYDGEAVVEGVRARLVKTTTEAQKVAGTKDIAIIVDPEARLALSLKPAVVVDARMAKSNLGTVLSDGLIVIGLGPGFSAGEDVHAVIETNRGHNLGRACYEGAAQPDTGVPAPVSGFSHDRVLKAPVSGELQVLRDIGEEVAAGDGVARVGGIEVRAAIAGILRGMARNGLHVDAGLKIGDIDPRADRSSCFTVSDKAMAIAGGVLEAILCLL